MSDAETSADVCYRHPDRTSWVLCQRCGRTICPECQILAPVGVQCPECVREAGGSVSWQRVGGPAPKPARAKRPARTAPVSSGTGFGARLAQMLRPGSTAPVLTWGAVGLSVLLWIGSLLTGNLVALLLISTPSAPFEIWRYATAAVAYPSGAVFGLLLNAVFFLLIAPSVERFLGRPRYAAVFLSGAIVGSASMMLAGQAAYGLGAALFALFGGYIILVWDNPQARIQALVIIGINVLINLFLGGGFALPYILGGLLAGAGATYLLRRYEGRARTPASRPYLIIAAVVAGYVLLTIARVTLLG